MATCPDCGNSATIWQNHELACRGCGLILEDAPVENELPTQKGTHPFLLEAGTFAYRGRIVTSRWILTTRQRNLHAAKSQIELIAERQKLPSHVTAEALLLFTQASNKELTHTRGNGYFVYASMYAACLIHGIPKTPLELTAYTGISKTKMLRAYRILKRSLELHMNMMRPRDLLHRFGSRLQLSPRTITRAAEIIEHAERITQGKYPASIAATALYLASKEQDEYRTQRQVANSTGVIEVTIRKHIKLLTKML